ncbi:transporter substrate-binding domain-containing protein [Govanella unica]|uniref:Transporter substrate-binding domain-containing protein n=1 Tax=Govanella unica TaxID=2975056 RepID=A0A9X3TZH1_9PROT|nr:transporter substrate-binding domain-containing protein [Govania unica]MDA5194438.1 transporter substrate-binding domain-containing protein [Govania unica]
MSSNIVGNESDSIFDSGCIRIALNKSNSIVSHISEDGSLSGPAVDIAHAFGRKLGLKVEFTYYAGPQDIVACAENGQWDLAFLAFDPSRTDRFYFTKPYLQIKATCAVRVSQNIESFDQLDQSGFSIASIAGTAFDLRLRKRLQAAQVVSFENEQTSYAYFLNGSAVAVAGIRSMLESEVETRPELRVLSDDFAIMAQAIAIQKNRTLLFDEIDKFLQNYENTAHG